MYPHLIGASGGDPFRGGGDASEHRGPFLKRPPCLAHAPHSQTPSTTHSLYRKAFFSFLLLMLLLLSNALAKFCARGSWIHFFLVGFKNVFHFFFYVFVCNSHMSSSYVATSLQRARK